MKKNSPLVRNPLPHQYRNLGAALLFLATVHSHAACGSGTINITTVPGLGGDFYNITSLNAVGQLSGFSLLPGNEQLHAYRVSSGAATDLGTLGGSFSYGYALNDSGQVVGDSLLPGDSNPPHAFLSDGLSMIDLGTLGGITSTAVGINNAGQVAGTLLTSEGANEAFRYNNGMLMSLGHLGGGYSHAAAINSLGNVTGNSLNDLFEQHAFLYAAGMMTDLGSLGGGYSDGFALNTQNVVVGESYLDNGELHGFMYANGVMSDLGTLGGSYSTAFHINSAGQIIGKATTIYDAETHGFIYSGGTMTDLGTLGGGTAVPAALNNLGQVVGQSYLEDGSPRAFLWQSGTLTDLNTLLPTDSNWVLQDARFINDSGRIVGTGTFNDTATWFILDLGGNNHAPTAVAQADQASACSGVVTLDGTQSSDPDGDALTFLWAENGTLLGTNATLTLALASGPHSITLTVSDPCGESAQATLNVTAGDTTPPTVTGPSTITSTGSTGCKASVPDLRSQVIASDNCTPANQLVITQSPAPGTVLSAGQYTITVTVADAAGNTTTYSTTMTVGDSKPPVFVHLPRPFTLSTGNDCQAKVPDLTRFVRAKDNCTPTKSLVITQSPVAGTLLDKGEHSIAVTVTDAAGNSTTRNVSFRIKDCIAPKIHSLTATPDVLAPANGKPVAVRVSVTATDNCDANPKSKIVGILCDESTSRGDIKITGDLTAELAATASDRGDGRVYILFISCQDASGNTTLRSVNVRVPKTKSDRPHGK